MDSGCFTRVAPSTLLPNIPAQPSPGSQRGDTFTLPNGKSIPNRGQKPLVGFTGDGQPTSKKVQLTDVKRPLDSVPDWCDSGHCVILGATGGYLYNVSSGNATWFPRVGRMWEFHQWIPKNKSQTFPRQGS